MEDQLWETLGELYRPLEFPPVMSLVRPITVHMRGTTVISFYLGKLRHLVTLEGTYDETRVSAVLLATLNEWYVTNAQFFKARRQVCGYFSTMSAASLFTIVLFITAFHGELHDEGKRFLIVDVILVLAYFFLSFAYSAYLMSNATREDIAENEEFRAVFRLMFHRHATQMKIDTV